MPDTGGGQLKKSSYVEVTFSPQPSFLADDPDAALNFDGFKGTQELGRPFFFELDMTAGKVVLDVSELIGATASIWLNRSGVQGSQDEDSYFHGIVTRIVSEGMVRGSYRYRMEIRPWIWLLTRITDCKIFQNKSPFTIITNLFRENGFSDFEDERKSSSGNTELEYCVQYRESTFDFVTRLMEEYGIYYFFKHEKEKHTLVFADDSNSHTELSDAIPYQFDQTEARTVRDHIWEWASDYGLHSGKFTVRDYNYTTPAADLTSKTVKNAKHEHGEYEVYEYPGPYKDTGEGQTHADVRMQAIVADRSYFHGASNCRKFGAGVKFKLDKFPDKAANKSYVIVRAEIMVEMAEGHSMVQEGTAATEGQTVDTYRAIVHAIPGDVPYRLHRKTPKPMIRGPQTAKVVGTAGEEIDTDQYGSVKVKFHWDRSDTQDEQRTCWIRVAQSWAGAGWGAMVIPRIGMEVVVEFLEGNPDRPLITGVVYNATQTQPYGLPGEKTKTTFKTNSTPGGGGSNEFRFEDKKGSEEVFFQAQKDYNKKVLNNETVEITQDTTTTVKSGNRSVTVSSGNDSLTVSAGNHSITVSGGKSDVNAATSITLTSGGSSIKISPSGIEISAPQIQIKASATMTLNGGGNMTLQAGMIAIN